ncbi:MAG TPA: glycosyltransferase family 4 protein [Pyrinomonadaceae bacterium]|nr:glycosyltransferase family 4 protein [Pyrinomonadaceae bacterium]
MKVLLLNQCFYPDVMATAQQLTDLAVGLVKEGHSVTVISGDRGYDDPSRRFPRRETWNGVNIIRISSLTLGKQTRWRRAANFASFLINCALRLLVSPRFDVVVALTSPPLISFLGSLFVRLKGGKFFFWVMDLNPDEAIAAGWLKANSLTARTLSRLLRYSLLHAERIIVLDRFMQRRIVEKIIPEERITVLPPWAHDGTVKFDRSGREEFRRQHKLEESFVVMYAGNHSPCHPLDTLVEAARSLSSRKEIVFCFVGGGSEQGKVREFADLHHLENIRCLPYQPFDKLAASLSAADLHVVVMGDEFVGIVHPSKLYNILTIGSPFLYIGPQESHVTEISGQMRGRYCSYEATHGDVESVVAYIQEELKHSPNTERDELPEFAERFSRKVLLPRLMKLLAEPELHNQVSSQSERAVDDSLIIPKESVKA